MTYSITISGHDDSPDIGQADKDEYVVEFTKRFAANTLRGVSSVRISTETFGAVDVDPHGPPLPLPTEPATIETPQPSEASRA